MEHGHGCHWHDSLNKVTYWPLGDCCIFSLASVNWVKSLPPGVSLQKKNKPSTSTYPLSLLNPQERKKMTKPTFGKNESYLCGDWISLKLTYFWLWRHRWTPWEELPSFCAGSPGRPGANMKLKAQTEIQDSSGKRPTELPPGSENFQMWNPRLWSQNMDAI